MKTAKTMQVLNAVMFADGVWHLLGSAAAGEQHWPDWVIARYFGASGGFPASVHRVLGAGLIAGSLAYTINPAAPGAYQYARIVVPVTTAVILGAMAITAKGDVAVLGGNIVTGLVQQVMPAFVGLWGVRKLMVQYRL